MSGGDCHERTQRTGLQSVSEALFTLIHPLPGHETSYNRWYEEDHLHATLQGPRAIAGARFVANRKWRGGTRPHPWIPIAVPSWRSTGSTVTAPDRPTDESAELYVRECPPRLLGPGSPIAVCVGFLAARASGVGQIVWVSPFVATVVGTDTYTDDL